MKALLIIFLIAFTFCQEEQLAGGWTRRSVEENDLYIEHCFKEAGADYIKSNSVDQDDLLRLTVHTQVVAGTNYKITFLDTKAEFPSIQEYVFFKALNNGKRNENDFQLLEHKEYQADNGLIPFNDPSFELLENTLYKLLKKSDQELKYVSYVYPIENRETEFFLITGYTADGEHKYVLCLDKASKEFYSFYPIK